MVYDQQLAKGRKKSKTSGMKSSLVKAVCRAVLQTLCPQGGKGEYKEGIVNVIQSAKASDTAAYASSGDDFLENRKLCREPLDSAETAAFWCNYMIYQI